MFELGKTYDFEILDGVDDDGNAIITTYPERRVVNVDGPLIKIMFGAQETILNTQSSLFLRATLNNDLAPVVRIS